MAYRTPSHNDGSPVELIPLTQLENNLVLMDKSTGHVGQQINGVDESALLNEMDNGKSYQDTKRRPSQQRLRELDLPPSKLGEEVPTWRMTLGNYVRTYPDGEVFVNDYKMFKNFKNPIKSIYDGMMDLIFETSVAYQATNPKVSYQCCCPMKSYFEPSSCINHSYSSWTFLACRRSFRQ